MKPVKLPHILNRNSLQYSDRRVNHYLGHAKWKPMYDILVDQVREPIVIHVNQNTDENSKE